MTGEASDLTVLLDAAAKGDRAAFQALYQKTAPKLFAIVLRIVRDRPAAEPDLCAGTTLQAFSGPMMRHVVSKEKAKLF